MKNQNPRDMVERVTKHTEVNIPPEDLVMAILARPGNYDACLLGLAHAYEARGERIADLEEDVERLRPREAFVPEALFEYEYDERSMLIDTECRGGLTVSTVNPNEDNIDLVLDKAQSIRLAKALVTWAGLPSGVEWRENIDPPPMNTYILIGGSKNTSVGYCSSSANWQESCRMTGVTHWTPLPKPPEST